MLAQQEDERHLRSRGAKFHANLAERGAASPRADGTLVSALGGRPTQKIFGLRHLLAVRVSDAQSRCAWCAVSSEDAFVQEYAS